MFECGSTGFQSSANYCCETTPNSKDACCSSPNLLFKLGAGVPTGGIPKSTTSRPTTSPAASASDDANFAGAPALSLIPSVSSSSVATNTPTPAIVQAPAPAFSDEPPLGAKIALGVAVPVVLLILGLLGLLLWRNRRNSRKLKDLQENLNRAPPSWNRPQEVFPGAKQGTSMSYDPAPLYTRPSQDGYYKSSRQSSSKYGPPVQGSRQHSFKHGAHVQEEPQELEPITRSHTAFELDASSNRF